MIKSVYKPAEDSFLLNLYVEKEAKGIILDMGTGNGIQAITAALNPKVNKVIAIDINPKAIEEAKNNAHMHNCSEKIDFLLGDLFLPLRRYEFDLIVFNPPYLPADPRESADNETNAWVGGITGAEVIEKFLKEAKNYLKFNGKILLILSSFTNIILSEIDKDYQIEILDKKQIFFEKIFCLSIKKRDSL